MLKNIFGAFINAHPVLLLVFNIRCEVNCSGISVAWFIVKDKWAIFNNVPVNLYPLPCHTLEEGPNTQVSGGRGGGIGH